MSLSYLIKRIKTCDKSKNFSTNIFYFLILRHLIKIFKKQAFYFLIQFFFISMLCSVYRLLLVFDYKMIILMRHYLYN